MPAAVLHAKNTTTASRRFRSAQGAVLFEVVLALVLFAGAAAMIGGGLHTAINGVERLRLNAHATDLAVSVMSELQMGTKSTGGGAQPFEPPFENWTWETLSVGTDQEPGQASGAQSVEVIIRHPDPPVVFRLSQMVRMPEVKAGGGTIQTGTGTGGALTP